MKLTLKHILPLSILIAGVSIMVAKSKADITIASQAGSEFKIVIPEAATKALKAAASEFQTVTRLATGAGIEIVTETAYSGGPAISLGETKLMRNAGFSLEGMTEDSFRIVTANGGLFIFGPDTPDDSWTDEGGKSAGTANGVYTFLEDFLDARWLMPGDLGRDVPKRSSFVVPEIDKVTTPLFCKRTLTHLHNYTTDEQRAESQSWADRLRLGSSAGWGFSHNWWQTIDRGFGGKGSGSATSEGVRRAFEAHPEWFPMNEKGERVFPENNYAKLETTNPGLVRFFADQAIERMKSNPRLKYYSLSPSDGTRGWSHSPETQALLESKPAFAPEIEYYPAVASSLIAKWYHDISKIVAEEYPEGRLTGYIYETYINPPTKIDAKLPPNFTPQLAADYNYGYGLYHPDTQRYFATIMDEWAKIITGQWFYYDLPAQFLRHPSSEIGRFDGGFPGSAALVNPTAPDMINIIFRQLVKSHIDGATIYGAPSGANGPLSNYIFAKMQWDPHLDAREVQRDWLHRAYGEGAGAVMERFYGVMDDAFNRFYNSEQAEKFRFKYEFRREMAADLYEPLYPELEKLLAEAYTRTMTTVQAQRLNLLSACMVALQWRLRNMGCLQDYESKLKVSDTKLSEMISAGDAREDFTLFPGVTASARFRRDKPRGIRWKVSLQERELEKQKANNISRLGPDQILIHAARNTTVNIATKAVQHDLYFASYELRNPESERIDSGIFTAEKPITFRATAGESYLLTIPLRKHVSFSLDIENAAIAEAELQKNNLSLTGKPGADLYLVHSPGDGSFALRDGGDKVLVTKRP